MESSACAWRRYYNFLQGVCWDRLHLVRGEAEDCARGKEVEAPRGKEVDDEGEGGGGAEEEEEGGGPRALGKVCWKSMLWQIRQAWFTRRNRQAREPLLRRILPAGRSVGVLLRVQ